MSTGLPSRVRVTDRQRTVSPLGETVFWSAFSSGTTVGLTISGEAGMAWVNKAVPTCRFPLKSMPLMRYWPSGKSALRSAMEYSSAGGSRDSKKNWLMPSLLSGFLGSTSIIGVPSGFSRQASARPSWSNMPWPPVPAPLLPRDESALVLAVLLALSSGPQPAASRMASTAMMMIVTITCRYRTTSPSLLTPTLSPPTTVQNPLLRSAATVVWRVPAVWASFVIGRCAKDVEVAVEVDIDLAAVLAGDFDLVGALFVADLGAGHAPSVGVIERDALGLLDVGSRDPF